MKLRDMMFLVIGGLLVISGMVLNTLLSGDAEAQVGVKDATFGYITCKGLYIKDGYNVTRTYLGLRLSMERPDAGQPVLQIYGDDGKSTVAYLGGNPSNNGEMNLFLSSKSETDKSTIRMGIDKNGGSLTIHDGEEPSTIGMGIDENGGSLTIHDGEEPVAYLGHNPYSNEMNFTLSSKSETDKSVVGMGIDKNGGRYQIHNKMGEAVATIAVSNDGGGSVELNDKFGYVKNQLQ